jgi:hypothetical protein
MPRQERKARLLVPDNGKGAGRKALQRMAGFTAVLVRRRVKLTAVRILVTVQAGGIFEPIERGESGWKVAFRAVHGSMLALEREVGLLVRLHRIQRRLESFFRVTSGALSPVGSARKLSPVRIRFMTISTSVVWDRKTKIAVQVAFKARYVCMLPFQRISGPIMVKRGSRLNLTPSAGAVAILAGAREGVVMRIHMTVVAFGEGQLAILDLGRGEGSPQMALLARHFDVKTR